MPPEQDFLPYAVGGSANVLSQAAYAALTSLLQNGLTSGIVPSNELNKILRQPSIMASVIGQFIVAETGQPAIDDGTTATLLANFTAAVVAASKQQVILTDTGAANAYAAANAVPLTALPTVSGVAQKFQVAHSNTGASTYAPDGLAAHPIFGLGGLALQGGEMPAGGVAGLVSYVGPLLNSGALCWVLYDCTGGAEQIAPATQSNQAVQFSQLAAVQSASKNLAASTTGLTAVVTLTADELVLESAAHLYITLRGVNLTASTGAASGAANSLDTGSWAQSTWYARHVIYNPTTTTTALLWSLSKTAPTLPAGYTFWAFTGWERTQSATNFNPLGMNQSGLLSSYVMNPAGNVNTLPIMSSGAVGVPSAPTNLAVAWAAFAPPDTVALDLFARAGTASAQVICSPNNSYGNTLNTAGLAPPISLGISSASVVLGIRQMMQVESANVYYANSDSVYGILQCCGFKIKG